MNRSVGFLLAVFAASFTLVALTLQLVGAAPAGTPNDRIYGANRDAEIFAIDLPLYAVAMTGTATPPLLEPNQAMAQSPLNQRVYYFERTFASNLFAYWDPVTGNNTVVSTASVGGFPKRLAFAPNGQLFMMDYFDRLFEVDVNTGNVTLLGPVPDIVFGDRGATGDLAFAPDGTVYLNTYGTLYTLDIPNLSVTEIYTGMLPAGDTSVWTGLAYCNDLLIGSSVYLTPFVSSLYEIDPATGVTTEVFSSTDPVYLMNDLTSCHPENVDYSDLSSSYGYALHQSPRTVQLGATVDNDLISTVDADDLTDDGITRVGVWAPGANVSIDANVVGGAGHLAGYFDWNNDGDFDDGQEQLIDQTVVVGVNNIAVSIPATATVGVDDLRARFRLYAGSPVAVSATGMVGDGEVEDYDWEQAPTAITLDNLTEPAEASSSFFLLPTILICALLSLFFVRRATRPNER